MYSSIRPCGLTNLLRQNARLAQPSFLSRGVLPQTLVRHGSGRPEKTEFEKRALELLKGFNNIDTQKLNLDAHFTQDLGLDSLDTVEVLMAIEDEFMIEIPDDEADQMHTVRQAIDFVYERWTPDHHW